MLFWCNACGKKFVEDKYYWCDIVDINAIINNLYRLKLAWYGKGESK